MNFVDALNPWATDTPELKLHRSPLGDGCHHESNDLIVAIEMKLNLIRI